MNAPRYWLMILILCTAGIGLHLISHGEAVPLEKPLDTLPMILGDWHGQNLSLEPRIVEAAAVDDYLYRVYQRHSSAAVAVYVGYYRSQRTGQWVHSPKNCLPGAGWEPVSSGRVWLALPNGGRAAVNLYIIDNGLQRQLVLYWYQAHGRIVASEYWGKIYMVLDALRWNRTDTALVRITTPLKPGASNASKEATRFAEGLLPDLAHVLPN